MACASISVVEMTALRSATLHMPASTCSSSCDGLPVARIYMNTYIYAGWLTD